MTLRTLDVRASTATTLSASSKEEIAVRPRTLKRSDVGELAGTALSALCLTWLIYTRLTPLQGGLGFVLVWYLAFLASYWLVVRDQRGRMAASDRLAAVVITTVGVGLLVPLLLVVGYTVFRGYSALRPVFFTRTQATVGPLSGPTEGGGAHAIVGTLEQVGLAMLVSVPLGLATALYLNEVGGRLARPVRLIVDAMSAIPSIVAGLFVYALVVLSLGLGQSGFAASLALVVLMLPTVTRTTEVVLRLVPGSLREASLALGASEWRTAMRVVLPTARTGLVTAVILGIARAVGETAPLLLTAGGSARMHLNPFSGSQDALPLFVYRLVQFPQPAQIDRAWTGALVLLAVVLVLFVAARVIGSRGPGGGGRLRRRPR
ncbi:MAG TPA: phosphate ABC transporter permease PstA [Acidimicrobiales bacterium]|nr:phosphate ABC transporter permease PstA [Acidimicrobiales bacterium]